MFTSRLAGMLKSRNVEMQGHVITLHRVILSKPLQWLSLTYVTDMQEEMG